MKKWIRVGIIILIIGVSLLAGTIYRSNTTTSFGNPRIDMAPDAWSYLDPDVADQTLLLKPFEFLLAPREFQLEVQSTAPVNVYILDSEGIRQWLKDKTVDPVFAFKDTKQGTYTFELSKRDKYSVILYNPTNENVTSRWAISVYGIEKDLLYISIAVITTGAVFTVFALISKRKPIQVYQKSEK